MSQGEMFWICPGSFKFGDDHLLTNKKFQIERGKIEEIYEPPHGKTNNVVSEQV